MIDKLNKISIVESPIKYKAVEFLRYLKHKIIEPKHVVYFPSLNLAYLHIPKCAGTSIITTLRQIEREERITKTQLKNKPEVFVFTIKRNGCERMKSAYKFMTSRKLYQERYNINEKTTFDEWKYRCKDDWHLKDFFELYRDVRVNFVGDFEKIDEDWDYICNIINYDIKLRRINITNEK